MDSIQLFQRLPSPRLIALALFLFAPVAAVHAVQIHPNEPGPYQAARGDALGYPDAVSFDVPGWAPESSWRITGTLPPGLSIGGLTSAGDFNTTRWPEITGTPTTAGTYNITLRASQGLNQAGPFTDVLEYQIFVSPDRYPPLFKSPPGSTTVNAGSSVTLNGGAYFGETYQWKFNGVNIAGATSDSLTLTASAANAGFYSVMAFGPGGSALSPEASLTVVTVPPKSVDLAAGQKLTLAVTVANAGGSVYQWKKGGVNIDGATSSTFSVTAVTSNDAGSYTVSVSNYAHTAVSAAALVKVDGFSGPGPADPVPPDDGPTDLPPSGTPSASRLSNLSVRTNLPAGQTLIVGFVTSGPKNLIARAVGPGLHTFLPQYFTEAQVYANPRISVFDNSSTLVATNDDWNATLASEFSRLGAFPLTGGSLDAGLIRTIDGPQTMHISGTGSGVVLFEGYDADKGSPNRLKNISARNRVGTGADILISGFVIEGPDSLTLLIRGIGPWLFEHFAIADRLVDPKLEIFNSDGIRVAQNDDWSPSLASVFTQVGATSLTSGSKDAALLVTLLPGPYTAQLSGVNGATGEAVVEIFEVR